MSRANIGRTLQAERVALGITVESAAAGAGMSPGQWLAIEKGRSSADEETLEMCRHSLALERDDAGMCHADWSRTFERLAVQLVSPQQYLGEILGSLVDQLKAAGYGGES